MEFRVLGPLEVVSDGRALELGGQKQRALLALLLLEANRVVSSERLIEGLWAGEPPGSARTALQGYVSQLRKLVGRERVETQLPGYVLHAGPDEVDLLRFVELREQGKPREALALWRGPALADLVYEDFAQPEIDRLEELRLACLEERIDDELDSGRHRELVAELEVLVREHPLRERLRALLMLALYRSGRQAEALDVYQQGRVLLVEQLGIDPGRELRDLHQAILNQSASLDRAANPSPTAASPRGAFVGREGELTELLAALDDAFAGSGRLVLLVGETGIGKSRLADELVARARARGARAVFGRCWEAGGAPAYWPWVQSLRACIGDTAPAMLQELLAAGAADLAQLLPELRELLPTQSEPPALDPDGARFRLFEATSSFLGRAALACPLVLVLDDLHAADEPSLLLLRFLARQLGTYRLLVVGACRNVDPVPSDPLSEALAELVREPVTRSLVLGGLPKDDVARFIEIVSGEPPGGALVDAIHTETEGNPLFVGEIVRLLTAEGRLDGSATPTLAVPQTVHDVIARRLRRLSERCQQVLVLASVVGRELSLDVLASLAQVSQNELLETLDEAMVERVVTDLPGSPGRLRFAHVLIRDTLYEGLTTARRVRLHRLAVAALEALYGDEPGAHLAELAHHAVAGSEFDKGLVYARRAGDRALELLAYEEAARRYETAFEALELCRPEDEPLRCELLLALGEAEIRAGNSAVAREKFLGAAAIARRLGLASELARAAVGYGGRIMFARAGADDRLVPLLEEGLAALGGHEVELRTRLLARLVGALRDEPSRERRERLSGEAVALARRSRNLAALAYALDGRGAAISGPDTAAECLAIGTELCEVAGRIRDPERLVYGHIHRFIALLQLGDVLGAEADLATAGRLAKELGLAPQLWQVFGAEAMLALAAGRLSEADSLIPRALEVGERALPWLAVPVYWLQQYTLCDFRGTVEVDLEAAITELAEAYPARRPVFRAALAHLFARREQADEAAATLKELAEGDFAAVPFDMEWLFTITLAAETSAMLSETSIAAVLYPLLAPWAAFNVIDMAEGIRGSVSRYLGLLAVTLGAPDDAVMHFEDALAMNERMGALPWLAQTQDDYAQMLLERDGPADRKRAYQLIGRAIAIYRELGMDGFLARVSALAQTVGLKSA